jgi:hypothetical protein
LCSAQSCMVTSTVTIQRPNSLSIG